MKAEGTHHRLLIPHRGGVSFYKTPYPPLLGGTNARDRLQATGDVDLEVRAAAAKALSRIGREAVEKAGLLEAFGCDPIRCRVGLFGDERQEAVGLE